MRRYDRIIVVVVYNMHKSIFPNSNLEGVTIPNKNLLLILLFDTKEA